MLRKTMLIGAAMLALGLGGCVTASQIDTTVQQVQTTTAQICRFVPTVGTVANIIASFAGGGAAVASVTDIANGVCNALRSPQARKGGVARYRGVAIDGNRI